MSRPGGNPDLRAATVRAGKSFTSTNQPPPENKGPKPSVIRAYIKENDLGIKDVQAAIRYMAEMTMEDLKKLSDDTAAPVLLRGFASAIIKEIKRGGLYNLETLMNRAFGKPKEVSDDAIRETNPIRLIVERYDSTKSTLEVHEPTNNPVHTPE